MRRVDGGRRAPDCAARSHARAIGAVSFRAAALESASSSRAVCCVLAPNSPVAAVYDTTLQTKLEQPNVSAARTTAARPDGPSLACTAAHTPASGDCGPGEQDQTTRRTHKKRCHCCDVS